MRLILVNPHTHTFGRSVSGVIFRRRDFFKYEYFLSNFVKNKERDVAFLIDGTRTSFNGIGLSSLFSFKIFAFFELIIWMILNEINPFGIKVYFNTKNLDVRKDVLFDFSRSLVDVDDQTKIQSDKFNGITIIHLTHYFKKTKKLSVCIKNIAHPILLAENELTSNAFFKKYFPYVKEVYQLPYAFGKRFVFQNKYKNRINKCLALGTVCIVKEREFVDFFDVERTLHPMRKTILNESANFPNQIDSLIRGADDIELNKKNDNSNFCIKIIKKIIPFVILEKFFPTSQIKYFQFDIVKKFNEYKMFICPDELVGLPSINVFEGMACQCAYIGVDSPIYTNLGMVPGIHYITYKEDDFEDFVLKVKYYQDNPKKLEKIANEGYNFVLKNFNSKNIADTFWNDLEKISQKFSRDKQIDLTCCFKNNN